MRGKGFDMHSTHPVDLVDAVQVDRWVQSVADDAGRIDILYANAGLTRFAPVAEIAPDEWDSLIDHEVGLVFLPIRYAWPHLVRSGSAAIILVGSTAGVRGSVTNPRLAHTAAKGAVIAMTRQLAAEGAAAGIRANCISPGMIVTPQSSSTLLADDHPMRQIAGSIPLGRLGTPVDVVNCAVFLASDEAGYVTGANLMVDGGWSAVLPG